MKEVIMLPRNVLALNERAPAKVYNTRELIAFVSNANATTVETPKFFRI